jgi:hypothetical protein
MDLLVAVLIARFLLVETGESAIMALVQAIIFLHWKPEAAHFFECEVQGLDRPCLDTGKADIRVNASFFHQLPCGLGFFYTLLGNIDIPPAGETILEIPLRLAMTKQDELGH